MWIAWSFEDIPDNFEIEVCESKDPYPITHRYKLINESRLLMKPRFFYNKNNRKWEIGVETYGKTNIRKQNESICSWPGVHGIQPCNPGQRSEMRQ